MKRNLLNRLVAIISPPERKGMPDARPRKSKCPLLRKTLLSLLMLLCVNVAFAVSWTTVGALAFSTAQAYYTTLAIDRSGTYYVAFQDWGVGQKATVMKYNGSAWASVGSAGFSAGQASYTSVALDSSGTPYVAYKDLANGGKVTVMKYNGSNWVVVGGVGFSAGEVENTSLVIDKAGTLYVSYQDYANSSKATVMKYNGSVWVAVGSAGFSASPAYYQTLAVDAAGTPYVAFQDSASGYKATVMKYNGSSWMAVGSPYFSAGPAYDFSIAIDASGTPYVAYRDDANGYKATVVKYDGSSWVAIGGAGFTPGEADNTSLVIDDSGKLYLSYRDFVNGSGATVMKYDGSSWAVIGGVSFTGSWTWFISMALDENGTPNIVYSDDALGNKASVKKYTGVNSSWTIVGSEGFSSGLVAYTSIAIDTGGKPYVAFRDAGYSNKATVMSYNGSSWAAVGSAGFSAAQADYTSLVLNSSGTPYVAYKDFGNGRKVTVKKYDGSNWVTVGSAGFSAGASDYVSLAVNRSGTPYVAYRGDVSTAYSCTVKKYDGGNWITVGGGAVAPGAWYTCVATDTSGTPYVAYREGSSPYRATVKKYDGSNWVTVGSAGFSGGNVGYTSLAIDRNNTPYVAYSDSDGRASVMKYNGTDWVYVGGRGFSTGSVIYTSLAVDSSGTPFVAFGDNNVSAATVMKFNGTNWLPVGSPGLSADEVSFTSLALNSAGQPYLAYRDDGNSMKATVRKFEFTLTPIIGAAAVCEGATTALSNSTYGGTWSSSNASVATVSVSGVVTGITPGNAVITYSASGTFVTATVTVNVAPHLNAIAGDSSVIVGETITLSNDSAGFWSVSNSNATISSSGILVGLSAGSVVVSFTSSGICGSAVETKVVTVNPLIPVVCVGETIALSFVPSGGTWSSSNTSRATVSATGVVTGLVAGTVIISYNMSGALTTVVVTVNAMPSVVGTASLCVGSTVALLGSAGGAWSSTAAAIATVGATGIVIGNAPGTAIIEYALSNGCKVTRVATVNMVPEAIGGPTSVCVGATMTLGNSVSGGTWSSSDIWLATAGTAGNVTGVAVGTPVITYAIGACKVTQTVNVLASPAAVGGTVKVCPGTTATLTDATAGGVWSSSDPGLGTVSAGGVVTGVAAGTVNIIYTIANGCSKSAVATINPNPADITGTGAICAGATTSLSSGTTGLSWTSSDVSKATVGISSGVVTGVAAGTSNITYKNTATGCLTTTMVAVSAAPAAIGGTAKACIGTTTSLSNATAGGTWSSSDPSIATVGTNGVVIGVAEGTTIVAYTIAGGCSRSVVLTINATPAISGSLGVCIGKSTMLTSSPGATSWASSNTAIAPVASGSVAGMAVGTADITVTVGTGCKAVVNVTVNPLPPAISGTLATCVGSTTTLSNAMSGGTWASYAPSFASINSIGEVAGIVVSNVMITYTSANGCVRTGAFTVNAAPTIAGTASICEGASVTLSAPAGGTWSSSAAQAVVGSTGIVTGVSAGNATISYTSAIGCKASRIVTVTVCSSRQAITGVGTTELNTQISMFPNPTNGIVTIQSPEAGRLSVLAVDGKEVANYHVNEGDTNIDLPKDLAAGVYMCRFNGNEGGSAMVRLIYQP